MPGRTYVERLPNGRGALVRKATHRRHETGITPIIAALFNSRLFSQKTYKRSKSAEKGKRNARVLSSPARLERTRSAKRPSRSKSTSRKESKESKKSPSVEKETRAPPPSQQPDGASAHPPTYLVPPFTTPYPPQYPYALPPGVSPYQAHCPYHIPPYVSPYATPYPIQPPIQQPAQQSAQQPAQQTAQQPVEQPAQQSSTPPASKEPMTRVVYTVSTESPGYIRRHRCRGCGDYRSEEYHRRVLVGESLGRGICRRCIEIDYSSDDDEWRYRHHRLGRYGIRRRHHDSSYRHSVRIDTDSTCSSDVSEEVHVTRRDSFQPTIHRVRSRSYPSRRFHTSYGHERVEVVETRRPSEEVVVVRSPRRKRSYVRTRYSSDCNPDDRYARRRTEVIEAREVPRHSRYRTSDISYDDGFRHSGPAVETVMTDVRPRHSRRSYISDDIVEVVRPAPRSAHVVEVVDGTRGRVRDRTTVAFEEPSRLRRVHSSRNIVLDSGRRPRGVFRYVDGAGNSGSSEEQPSTGPADSRRTTNTDADSRTAPNSSFKTEKNSSSKTAQSSSFKTTPNTSFQTKTDSSFQTPTEHQTPSTSWSSQDQYTTRTAEPKYYQRTDGSGSSGSQERYPGHEYSQRPSSVKRGSTHGLAGSFVNEPKPAKVASKKPLGHDAHEQDPPQLFQKKLHSRASSWSTHHSREPAGTGESFFVYVGPPKKQRDTSSGSQDRQASQSTDEAQFHQPRSHSKMSNWGSRHSRPTSEKHDSASIPVPQENIQARSTDAQDYYSHESPPAESYQSQPLSRVSSWSTHPSRKSPPRFKGTYFVAVGPEPSSKNPNTTSSSNPSSQNHFPHAPGAASGLSPVEIAAMFEGVNIDPGANQAKSIFENGEIPRGRPLSEFWAAQKEPDGWDIGWENVPGFRAEDLKVGSGVMPEPVKKPFVHRGKGSKKSEELFYYKDV